MTSLYVVYKIKKYKPREQNKTNKQKPLLYRDRQQIGSYQKGSGVGEG